MGIAIRSILKIDVSRILYPRPEINAYEVVVHFERRGVEEVMHFKRLRAMVKVKSGHFEL